jgi:hypothetical protein
MKGRFLLSVLGTPAMAFFAYDDERTREYAKAKAEREAAVVRGRGDEASISEVVWDVRAWVPVDVEPVRKR